MKKLTRNLKRKLQLLGVSTIALLILSGCVDVYKSGPHKGEPTGAGWVYNFLVKPMSDFVDLFVRLFGGAHAANSFGWAVIFVTLIVRLIILPLGLRQQYKSTYMQEKMAYLAPVFNPINERMKAAREARDQAGMLAAQQQLQQAQRDNGINMLSSMGCLPMLIQYPFFIALYNAARYTNGISTASFYGIDLGKTSIFLAILAGVFYLGQSWIMIQGLNEEQRKQQQTMLWISPVMIILFSFWSPAGVTLYWVVGGLVVIIQQLIVTYYMKPRMKRQIDAEFKANPPKMADLPKDVTPTDAETTGLDDLVANTRAGLKDVTNSADDKPANGRNAGKQHRH
ncbi:MAG: membrane protein insertase YidC [Streptococcaceae bacterium]|jgi:YidC/Oxa1 family membrane protein insertase|nr:membrane protein insertase YidC [Streptococcaceae bacterium]